jgi:hypothetical protein
LLNYWAEDLNNLTAEIWSKYSMQLKVIGLAMGAIAMTVGAAGQAQAEVYATEIEKAFFATSGDLYENASIGKQFQTLLGLSFSDSEFRKDAASIEVLYRQGMKRQSGVPLSTPDLANPFNTSIYSNPGMMDGR